MLDIKLNELFYNFRCRPGTFTSIMEYSYNSRPSLIPDYQLYYDFLAGTGTIRAEVVSVSPISSVHVHGPRIANYFGTNQYQQFINFPRALDQFVLRRSCVHLNSYAGNIRKDPDVFAFPVDSTISVVASNVGPVGLNIHNTINNSSLLQVCSNVPPCPSADRRRSGYEKIRGAELKNNHNLKSESRASDKRKTKRPQKSAIKGDPAFRGVSFQLELRQGKVRLRTYRGGIGLRSNRCRQCHKGVLSSTDSISEIEMDVVKGVKPLYSEVGKKCSSCDTKKTPLWRDAEDGTPLCNACGIRYKKYRIRCVSCWFIPRKEGKANAKCHRCGDPLRVALGRRIHSPQPHIM